MRLTVADCKAEVAEAASLNVSDSRVYTYLNKAVKRLLPKGKWVGTTERYRMTATDALIVWPRRFQTIEAFAACKYPSIIRNGWYEFLQSGPGIIETDGSGWLPGSNLIDREEVCGFAELSGGTTSVIRTYADVAEAATATITYYGYDENDNWIRTNPGGVWQDGETVAIVNPGPVPTTKFFTKLTAVRKDETNGTIRAYEWDGATSTAIGIYEWDELNPQYRRSYAPMLENVADADKLVDVVAKLRYRDVSADEDALLITCVPALVEEIRALRMYEANMTQEGMAHESIAVRYLNEQLNEFFGAGHTPVIKFQHRDEWGGGGIENVVS